MNPLSTIHDSYHLFMTEINYSRQLAKIHDINQPFMTVINKS